MKGSGAHIEVFEGIRYLNVDALIHINEQLILQQTPDERIGVLKRGELSSSQQRPAQHRYYAQEDDMFVLAAVLIESLIQNHPFENANKRTAAMAGAIFLLINGYELTAPEHELVEIMVGVARHEYTVEELESWLAMWSRDFDTALLNERNAWVSLFGDVNLVAASDS
ncbi:type II toxin-antitoxin system death-on-curing family toxin [Stutzerimonas stutzeri]|uniref:type II toxin-antitoxin system death-on-curing family toxin n=1 Tax=Stutzerimonas stutzeri TaxID=316 RepID=UPI0021088B38|nr:type II toxin-antitoxin system death-on-curing family toxin [Stutzerimonas stutzeri]MCQ4257437.1 type II toxin-antitoxin system death-on-curing family toxin [Stutzerimonas stutzeri]